MCRGAYIHYFKINPPIFCCPRFSENYLNPKVNKMMNKHTIDYHPSPSQLISRIHIFLIFLWTPTGLISPESFLNFFLNLYIPSWLLKSFKFIVLRLLQIHLWVKNLNLFICTHAPKQNSPSDFYHYLPGRWELPIPPGQRFLKIFFPWAERGERIILINSTMFAIFTFLVYVLLCNNLASSMLKCEGSLI